MIATSLKCVWWNLRLTHLLSLQSLHVTLLPASPHRQVHELAEQIGKKLARAEELGADGLVEESMKLMEEVSDG